MIFAQYVDDPSSYIDDEVEADRERQRLLNLIERLVPWEASTDMAVIGEARLEIARSWERSHGGPPLGPSPTADEVNQYLGEHVAAFCDPFCGGGALPLEAQRLGLRVFASDKNPVAVLITKALIEIPPRFADMPPVNPRDRDKPGPDRKPARRSRKRAAGAAP